MHKIGPGTASPAAYLPPLYTVRTERISVLYFSMQSVFLNELDEALSRIIFLAELWPATSPMCCHHPSIDRSKRHQVSWLSTWTHSICHFHIFSPVSFRRTVSCPFAGCRYFPCHRLEFGSTSNYFYPFSEAQQKIKTNEKNFLAKTKSQTKTS